MGAGLSVGVAPLDFEKRRPISSPVPPQKTAQVSAFSSRTRAAIQATLVKNHIMWPSGYSEHCRRIDLVQPDEFSSTMKPVEEIEVFVGTVRRDP